LFFSEKQNLEAVPLSNPNPDDVDLPF